MDSFYASVEVARNPSLKGKPVIIGADPKGGLGRGVVTTCSYEARKFGVKSAMPISIAYRLCPQAVYLPVNMRLYGEVSERIMRVLKGLADKFEPAGIDEAFLDVTKKTVEYGGAKPLAEAIKRAVLEAEGLTCSIGVGPNKSIAKIASDMNKPDGLTIVEPEMVASFLEPLQVSKILGVGKKTKAKLGEMGIETVGQLAKCQPEQLTKILGRYGYALWLVANGIDESEVSGEYEGPKSISTERTFESDVSDRRVVHETIDSLAEILHDYARESHYLYRTVTLKLRFEDFQTFTRSRSVPFHTQEKQQISVLARELMKEFEDDPRKIRLVGIKLSNLAKTSGTLEPITKWVPRNGAA